MNAHETFRGKRRRAGVKRMIENAKRRAVLRGMNFPAHMSTGQQEKLAPRGFERRIIARLRTPGFDKNYEDACSELDFDSRDREG